MPSNKKRGNNNNNSNNHNKNNNDDDDLKQEGNVKLQAVLLADSVFGSKTTKNQGYQSFGLRPWSAEASTSVQILCTINNVPLVDYVLDFLTSNGVEQVIVVTGSESSALEDYIVATTNNNSNNSNISNNNISNNNNASSSSSNSSNNNKRNLEILFLRDTSLTNAGDALRELYKRNWIRASKQALPFLLVSGDVVADLDLKEAMRAHKDRHSHDSAAVMTVVLKPVKQSRRSSSSSTNSTSSTNSSSGSSGSIVPRASELVVGLVGAFGKTIATADAQGSEKDPSIDDSKDYRIMYYENGSKTSSYMLPCSFLAQCQTQCQTQSGTNSISSSSSSSTAMGGLVVRHDLMDTGIAICSPDVLGRLEDEFDYLDLAHDFVTNSVAEEEDGLQTRIYAHVLEDATSSIANNGASSSTRNYAARVVDFQTFHAVSRDLLRRWAYPTVADRTILSNNNSNSSIGTKETNKRYKLVEVADHNHHRRSGYNNTNRPLVSLENNNNNKKNSTNSKNKSYDPFSKISSSHNNNQYQYKEVLNPTKVSRTSVVVGPGMMGSYGTVGEDCLVARCVLGDSVTIGDGSRLVDCHLMDNVVIESGATLDSCVLASKAMVREGAVLGTGCYIGEGCIVGAGITLKPFTRVTLAKDDEDDDWGDSDGGYSDTDDDDDGDIDIDNENGVDAQNVNTGDCDQNLVGADGRGKLWKPVLDDLSSDDEDSDSGGDPLEELLQLQSIGGDPTSYYRREERRLAAREARDLEDDGFSDRDENEMDEMMDETRAFSEFTGGTVTFGNGDDDLNYTGAAATAEATVIGRQKGIDVVREMTEICMEFDDECHPIENLAIELNSFKFSQNATYGDCAQACLLSLLRKMEVSPSMSDGRMVSLLKAKLDKFWTGMLQKLCRGTEEEVSILEALEHAATIDQQQQSQSQTPTDPESVDALQKSTEIAEKLRSGMAFRFFLQTLHDQEVLSEEAILQWAGDRRKAEAEADVSNDPKQSLFQMQSVQDFLEWLEDEDSDDDDDESDDDDDDSDSD